MGCQGQACYNLISVIVGHYVNCTSRLQFLCHASSVLSWLMFGKQGAHFFSNPLFMQGRSTDYAVFSTNLCFAFTLSQSHMEAAQSSTVCHQENAQRGVKVSISVGVAEYCLFIFSTHLSRNTWESNFSPKLTSLGYSYWVLSEILNDYVCRKT